MFQSAIRDESLYPPKCCQARIVVSDASDLLDSELVEAFVKKSVEYDTRDRLYCHKPRCSAFLGAATNDATPLRCPECCAETCGLCKVEAHPKRECSDTQELNDVAKEMHEQQGWQRCYSCHHLVEKSDGCHHITCVCAAEFCYLCATRWKECACPRFDVPDEVA